MSTTSRNSRSFVIAIILAALAVTTTSAAPATDIAALQASCDNASGILNASLNGTASVNTAQLVQDIGFQVGASQANMLDTNMSSTATTTPSSNNSSTAPTNLDPAYFNYAGSLNTLAEALMRRGRVFHAEANAPVYVAIQGVAAAVENYALQLRNANVISQDAFVRSLSVQSDLVEAESAWADAGNSPVAVRGVAAAAAAAGTNDDEKLRSESWPRGSARRQMLARRAVAGRAP